MRYSDAFIPTLKEDPKETIALSHNLMVRAGLIRRFTSGVYTYLPAGLKILHKVIDIVRDEMNKAGALEVLLPALHPLEIWQKTGRDKTLADVLYKLKSPHERDLVLGPTHEEVITDLISKEINSYKQLPLILYQIQTKFRDEPRPKSGILRSLEFIMKDAYSFNCNFESLEESYNKMKEVYCNIFSRCGLPYVIVEADPGAMGGNVSHEFMVISDIGEDKIALCENCNYSASLDIARYFYKTEFQDSDNKKNCNNIEEVYTPGKKNVKEVSSFLKVSSKNLVKTLIYKKDLKFFAVLIRADYDINEVKLRHVLKSEKIDMASDKEIEKITGGPTGFSGPVNLEDVEIIADFSVKNMNNFITGANKKDAHYINVNLERDFKVNSFNDIRFVQEEDLCPVCQEKIKIKKAIEIGHIFKLGTKYSKDLKADFLSSTMKQEFIIMGCYGIGINRILAACVESNHDKEGIIWPLSIAPFEILIIPVTELKGKVEETADLIYNELVKYNIDVLLDDRDERAGVKFKDADLLGIPYRIIIGSKNLEKNKVEIQIRKNKSSKLVDKNICIEKILEYIK